MKTAAPQRATGTWQRASSGGTSRTRARETDRSSESAAGRGMCDAR
jgi:hypothetical protein